MTHRKFEETRLVAVKEKREVFTSGNLLANATLRARWKGAKRKKLITRAQEDKRRSRGRKKASCSQSQELEKVRLAFDFWIHRATRKKHNGKE